MTARPDPVFPEATLPAASRAEVFGRYLDYFRESLIQRVESLDDSVARSSIVPSRWSPRDLVVHLTHVERRWLVWGFAGRDVGDPWGDHRDGRWYADPDVPTADLVDALREQAVASDAVIAAHDLAEVGAPGPRWDGAAPATLERVLFHLVQEYARHLGQLDVVAELGGGATGE